MLVTSRFWVQGTPGQGSCSHAETLKIDQEYQQLLPCRAKKVVHSTNPRKVNKLSITEPNFPLLYILLAKENADTSQSQRETSLTKRKKEQGRTEVTDGSPTDKVNSLYSFVTKASYGKTPPTKTESPAKDKEQISYASRIHFHFTAAISVISERAAPKRCNHLQYISTPHHQRMGDIIQSKHGFSSGSSVIESDD